MKIIILIKEILKLNLIQLKVYLQYIIKIKIKKKKNSFQKINLQLILIKNHQKIKIMQKKMIIILN